MNTTNTKLTPKSQQNTKQINREPNKNQRKLNQKNE